MKVLHGTWIPDEVGFEQTGAFYLWVETSEVEQRSGSDRHPYHLDQKALAKFLIEPLKFSTNLNYRPERNIEPRSFLLPTVAGQPLPSLELSRYLETELPRQFSRQYWQIDCYRIGVQYPAGTKFRNTASHFIVRLKDLHYLAQQELSEVQLGADLLFWYRFTQAFKQVILRDQYIPALRYRDLSPGPASGAQFEIYPSWEIISDAYEDTIRRYAESMPLICASGFAEARSRPQHYDRETLLRHCSEVVLSALVQQTPLPQAFTSKINDSLLQSCLEANGRWRSAAGLARYQQWLGWRDRIRRPLSDDATFTLCFQLQEPPPGPEPDLEPHGADPDWRLIFLLSPKAYPSVRIPLADYWTLEPFQQRALKLTLGESFESDLLLHLGHAARIYPRFWEGLDTDRPKGIELELDAAFEFLKEAAWVLEDAGYKVIVPAWWTPQGRRRAKLRLNASSTASDDNTKGYFGLATLVEYQYELSLGGESVSPQEWERLVATKEPLVQFRGQWMEIDRDRMQELLNFWQRHKSDHPTQSLLEFMQTTAQGDSGFEVEVSYDRTLSEMMTKLNDKSQLRPVADPARFQGRLREYQKRGLAWLQYLEQLGLNGCLADDMGLGKTVQVIARLVQEATAAEAAGLQRPPTLLIAPTSVLGNWLKELEKFSPQLRVAMHHGSDRAKTIDDFQAHCQAHDVVITSFALARRDAKLLDSVDWLRIVLDEAQNIKNPQAAQTKAILKLSAPHRLALTGTPVENRLLDLWSIFNFLNPGYLGKETQFRQNFEIPIQKNNDTDRSVLLKKLVEPFILRRVKTDQAIIKDLPEKVEQKLYCSLTKEQASLYAATVRDVERQLQLASGMQRRGLILSTLMKLKQICNHPAQFLHDGSPFTPARSHKLGRLDEMAAEVIEEGDSLLVFTQFREIGAALEKHLRHQRYNLYYLHGGTSRKKREEMIAEFQRPNTEPSVFILSLKAGGVGITLTKANHVFHFDRWWNPAVEDQASDRAFRIGQKKTVFVHKFVALGTLEERIDQMIEDKKKLAGAVVGSDESWLTELDNESFKQLIALNQSAMME
ncbi:DEAD/DEAH box helicase [Romeria aff. gracilis LEGE 07310]|uniref:DEAD/DEAH box helicase n=1 Tax=Vasconcelosia minhoensis LEGE 07310 TaxID=915328 RepID=A0A8J7AI15_9CYAN|nr:DEAD/DEAH box helicase [Romeria gracilis]MBE9079334.1 DEAD/DEAH box helicase [Romeria aff. gracilis LEGE 07310]